MPKFEGPECHLRSFKARMNLCGIEARAWPAYFLRSLKGTALTWFCNLEPERVETWEQIVTEFTIQYGPKSQTDPVCDGPQIGGILDSDSSDEEHDIRQKRRIVFSARRDE